MCLGVEEIYASSLNCNPPHVNGEVFPRDGFESDWIHISVFPVRNRPILYKCLGPAKEMTYVEKNPATRPKNCSTEMPRALSANGKSSTR
jgi:hypothetical protein